MGAEVEADTLGDEWKGYVVRIAGGNDKQGFPMKQGVLTNGTSIIVFTYIINSYNTYDICNDNINTASHSLGGPTP